LIPKDDLRFDAIGSTHLPPRAEREDTGPYQPTIDHHSGPVQENSPDRAGRPNSALFPTGECHERGPFSSSRAGFAPRLIRASRSPTGLAPDSKSVWFEGGVYARRKADREGQHLQFAGDYQLWLAALAHGR
jgi:hypothetical protein